MRKNFAEIAVFRIDGKKGIEYHKIKKNETEKAGEAEALALKPQQFNPKQQMLRRDFELQYKRDSYLSDVELHHHDFYELYYLVSGDVTYTIESKRYKVLPGDVLLISPRELHQVFIQAEHAAYERYVLWISPELIAELSTDGTDLFQALDPIRPGYGNQLRLQSNDQQKIRSLMEQIYLEQQEALFGRELLSRSLLTQLLVTINRLALREDCHFEDISRSSRAVSQVIEYINLHYSEPLALDMLAETFFVSKYHLSHEFQRQVGTSVCRYIQKKRVQIARQLLAGGNKPNNVYGICGFGDYTGFYRAFKAEYGTSPREYAESLNKGTMVR